MKLLQDSEKSTSSTLQQRRVPASVVSTNGGTSLHDVSEKEFERHHAERMKEKQERESIVLWRRPFTTLQYFILESLILIKEYSIK